MHAELALEREDLIASVRALDSVKVRVASEVQATKRVWPTVAKGLPASPAPLRTEIEAAAASASTLPVPAPFGEEQSRRLTGASVAIAGTYRTFALLARSGWQLLAADARAIERGPPAAASFARANVGLYIESIYDAHFALAQIGEKVHKAFHDLGGPAAFTTSLIPEQVEAVAGFYSEAIARLTPRAATKLGS